MSAEAVKTAFLQQYYTCFDTNRANLAGMYEPTSTLSWEGKPACRGGPAILSQLNALGGATGAAQVKHVISTQDCLPGQTNNQLLIFVTGSLTIDGPCDRPRCRLRGAGTHNRGPPVGGRGRVQRPRHRRAIAPSRPAVRRAPCPP